MEKVQDAGNTIEIFENDIQMYLTMFCEENGIEDMKKESQSVWNSALYYIYKHVFKNGCLKDSNNISGNSPILSNYNRYNYNLCMDVLDIYIYELCLKYDKEVSIIGYCTLTGINQDTIHDWGKDNNKLSSKGCEIYKKLNEFREESLSNKLVTGKQNPVGILGVLNRHYQWNMPGVSREQASRGALTAAELPRLSENCARIGDNSPEADTENRG